MPRSFSLLLLLLCVFCLAVPARAEVDHHQGLLQSIFPAGGQRGTEVSVMFTGNNGGLKGADGLLIDGAPGLTVTGFEAVNDNQVKATIAIAADAAPGRRMIRVKGGTTGLTNFRWFFVGSYPEHVESTKNNTRETAEVVEAPVIVNGRIENTLDQDCFQVYLLGGCDYVLAVQSHWLDAMGFDRNTAGFADASLELLDASGKVVAADGDTLGYDPLIHWHPQEGGEYTVRVSGMGYKGFPQFVYRLAIVPFLVGEVPTPTAVFPPGGQRGKQIAVQFSGPHARIPGQRERGGEAGNPGFFGGNGPLPKVAIDEDSSVVQYAMPEGAVWDLPLVRSNMPEIVQEEPGTTRETATAITSLPGVINGRFGGAHEAAEQPAGEHWFRLKLAKQQSLRLDVLAQRHLRSPVDTLLEVFDAEGKKLAANDDGELLKSEVVHEFVPFDSQLAFTAKTAGEYFVRLAEQSGVRGPRAVYRLTVQENQPDFDIYQWPDAVTVWGPGTTAAFVVETHRHGNLKGDIELAIEGLPAGWTGSTATAFGGDYRHAFRGAFGHKTFLTITAPADAEPGTVAEFQVMGRVQVGEREVSHQALPLTQLAWGEPNRFRAGTTSRVVVARPQGLPISTTVTELTATAGGKVSIPLTLAAGAESPGKPVKLSVNRAGTHFKCAVGGQLTVAFTDGKATLDVPLPAGFKAGRAYEILVSDVWTSETRKGLPGPCTRPIRVRVEE